MPINFIMSVLASIIIVHNRPISAAIYDANKIWMLCRDLLTKCLGCTNAYAMAVPICITRCD